MTMTAERIAADQLHRMRGMTGLYHQQFFNDIRWTTVLTLAAGIAGATADTRLFLVIPFLALMGAVQTAFDASYLIFARQYAVRLERFLNQRIEPVLVAGRLEDAYLFPLDKAKVVTMRLGGDFSWFGFMTGFYTLIGVITYATGLALGLGSIDDLARYSYIAALAGLTLASLGTGMWWFAGGVGESRLRRVFEDSELFRT